MHGDSIVSETDTRIDKARLATMFPSAIHDVWTTLFYSFDVCCVIFVQACPSKLFNNARGWSWRYVYFAKRNQTIFSLYKCSFFWCHCLWLSEVESGERLLKIRPCFSGLFMEARSNFASWWNGNYLLYWIFSRHVSVLCQYNYFLELNDFHLVSCYQIEKGIVAIIIKVQIITL